MMMMVYNIFTVADKSERQNTELPFTDECRSCLQTTLASSAVQEESLMAPHVPDQYISTLPSQL